MKKHFPTCGNVGVTNDYLNFLNHLVSRHLVYKMSEKSENVDHDYDQTSQRRIVNFHAGER